MKASWQMTCLLALAVTLPGCGGRTSGPVEEDTTPASAEAATPEQEARIKANLARLNEDDRLAAETQRYCAVQSRSRLGSMGVPVKITLKNRDGEEQEVFLCCAGCEKGARKDEAGTAARVDELNIQGNLARLGPEDRKLAEAQKFCAAHNASRLGSMGPPQKVLIQGQPVFVCCGGCIRAIHKDEQKTLAVVEELKRKNAAK
jgi:hypothetical protein